jgi:nucleotide-binding universal stress UspA family protein
MRILCAIDLRHGAEVVQRVLTLTQRATPDLLPGLQPELLLAYVVDPGQRPGPERLRGPFGRGPHHDPAREQAMEEAETLAAEEALGEALAMATHLGAHAEIRLLRGRPEQALVALAREVAADLIALRLDEWGERRPPTGPGSVGHTARFVLDHAPCDVLLIRS